MKKTVFFILKMKKQIYIKNEKKRTVPQKQQRSIFTSKMKKDDYLKNEKIQLYLKNITSKMFWAFFALPFLP